MVLLVSKIHSSTGVQFFMLMLWGKVAPCNGTGFFTSGWCYGLRSTNMDNC